MKGTILFVFAGLLGLSGYARAQMNALTRMAMMNAMGGGGSGGGGGGMSGLAMMGLGAGGGMPEMSMQDLMLASSLGGGGSGAGGAAGGGGGGPDLSALMLAQGGGMGGGEMSLPIMLAMMGGQGGNQGGAGGQPTSIANRIASALGDSGSGITPSTQNSLWALVTSQGHSQRIMDAIGSMNDRIQLARDGLPGMNRMMVALTCPPPALSRCMPAFCETPETSFTPESFYVCPGCPTCSGGAAGQLMRMFGGARGMSGAGGLPGAMMAPPSGGGGGSGSGGMDMARNLMLMQAMQQSGGQMSPAMMAALMSMGSDPQPQPPTSVRPTISMMMPPQMPPMPQGFPNIAPPGFRPQPQPRPQFQPQPPTPSGPAPQTPASTSSTENKPAPPPEGTPNVPSYIPPAGGNPANMRPPPAFIEAMRRLGQSMSQQRKQINNPPQPTAAQA